MTTVWVFSKIRAIFSNFQETVGKISLPPPLPPSSYAPAKYDSDNDKMFVYCFCEIPHSDILSLANNFSVVLFPTFFTLFFKIKTPVIKIKFLQRRI